MLLYEGGGSQGCNTLYQLAKRGCKAVLLERSKLTSGKFERFCYEKHVKS